MNKIEFLNTLSNDLEDIYIQPDAWHSIPNESNEILSQKIDILYNHLKALIHGLATLFERESEVED